MRVVIGLDNAVVVMGLDIYFSLSLTLTLTLMLTLSVSISVSLFIYIYIYMCGVEITYMVYDNTKIIWDEK